MHARSLGRWLRGLGRKPVAAPATRDYWNDRYAAGGDSGVGSYGKFAAFKAETLNAFVGARDIRSVIEFGCGDGNQLALARYPRYVGLDVARSAVLRCRDRFADDPTKSFFLYDPECFVDRQGLFAADLALSLDVIYHLVEEAVFERYMTHLFGSARRFVLVYSTDTDDPKGNSFYIKHRRYTDWIRAHAPDWRLIETIPNRYPDRGDYREGSAADFRFFARA